MIETIVHGTTDNFENVVIQASELVVVDFGASWCGPCRMLEPHLQRLASVYAGRVKVVKVDVDEEAALAQQFQIRSVPTMFIYKNGSLIEAKSGLMHYPALENWVESRLN